MKAIWKGSLSFGLVTIPVELFSAVSSHSLGFTLLHQKCKTPINYMRWCPTCKKEAAWDDIVKGLPTENDTYFIITKENLEKLKPQKSDTFDILEFVDAQLVEPIYFDQHYYIVPKKTNEKAYFLLQQALEKLNKVAIGRFILKEKEHIGALQPFNGALLLTTLNYSYEIKPSPLVLSSALPKVTAQEIQLATELIKKLSKKKFDMSKYKDTFAEKVRKELKQAPGKKKAAAPAKKKVPKTTTKPTLIDSLRASLS